MATISFAGKYILIRVGVYLASVEDFLQHIQHQKLLVFELRNTKLFYRKAFSFLIEKHKIKS